MQTFPLGSIHQPWIEVWNMKKHKPQTGSFGCWGKLCSLNCRLFMGHHLLPLITTTPDHFNPSINLCSHSFCFLVCPLRLGMFNTESNFKLCDRNLQNAFFQKIFFNKEMLVTWAEAGEFPQLFPWVIKLHLEVDCFSGDRIPSARGF